MTKRYFLTITGWLIFWSFGGFVLIQGQDTCNANFPLFQVNKNGKVGFINKSGDFIIRPEYDRTFPYFIHGVAAAQVDKLWGIIDLQGNWIIKPQYKTIVDITQNLFIVRDHNEQYLVIDRKSQTVVATYDEIYNFRGELAPVRISKKWGFIDLNGNLTINPQFDDAGSFSEGLASVRLGDKNFYINKFGQKVIQLDSEVEVGGLFKEGLAKVKFNGRYGFIDRDGKLRIKTDLRDVSPQFDEGFASFSEDELVGFINQKGEKAIPAIYDDVDSFTEGLARVAINKKSGFIDQNGDIVIPLRFDTAGTFRCGVAYVEINGKWGLIDKKGNLITRLFPL